MEEGARAAIEADVRRRCDAGDHDGAATAALRGYGREIFGFLVALHKSEEDASDVFSLFSEALWKGLPKFAWQCSLRTWAYTIARNASFRFKKNAQRRAKGQVGDSLVEELAQQIRTETRSWLRTEQKDKFAAIRATLPEEDQTLLILRVDRGLQWEELARIMMGDEADIDDAKLKTESARLRKRFQLVKEKLVELGKKTGLIKPKE